MNSSFQIRVNIPLVQRQELLWRKTILNFIDSVCYIEFRNVLSRFLL